ncbi:MAG: hypothetical protein CO094_13100 [Anaerolineae bacterium CG_4_9_14_3_um_filter_57_17]|nr:hypothetical protein [bacterium]NCT21272.1 hypothetical protein [bacterium]OIO86484.1 MAG: hypothetical protein AUK01_03120 [Anaerolineae bacterium CG2_30_57_67]PJB64465.1 MAG: hypothetical protein CO094_13100 [Anaerolineae bacterium CG_4_9_14_3_um_filter_57_17]
MQPVKNSRYQGIEIITWEHFGELIRALVEKIAPEKPDVIIGIARGGLIPATALATALRCEMFPIRLTRRMNDEVVHHQPVTLLDVAMQVINRQCAIVMDDLDDTGQTLALGVQRVRRRGVPRVLTASLAAHTWADPAPNFTALTSDALVVFPWDAQVYEKGQWKTHPEIEAVIKYMKNQ